jgi:hypothetical protein
MIFLFGKPRAKKSRDLGLDERKLYIFIVYLTTFFSVAII